MYVCVNVCACMRTCVNASVWGVVVVGYMHMYVRAYVHAHERETEREREREQNPNFTRRSTSARLL